MSTIARSPAQTLADAVALHSRGDLEGAARRYREVLRALPDHADALHMLGVVECAQGRPDEGAGLIERATARARPHPMLARNLATAYVACGRLEDARRVLDAAVARFPADAPLELLYARVLYDGERHTEAARWYDAAHRHAPSEEALAGSIRARLRLGRVAEALALVEGVAVAGAGAELLLATAHALTEAGDLPRARECIDRALAPRPRTAATLLAAGAWHAEYGAPDAAETLLRECMSLDPGNASAGRRLATVLSARGRDAEAAAVLRPLADAPDAEADLHLDCGLALASSNDFASAGPYVRRARALAPDSLAVALAAGRFHAARREHREALECFRAAARLDPACLEARVQSVHTGLQLAEWDDWHRYAPALARVTAGSPEWSTWGATPFALLTLPVDGRALRRAAERYVAATTPREPRAAAPSRPIVRGARPLRIGYLSADFRRHPVGKLVAHTLAAHDRREIEVVGVSVGVPAADGRADRRRIVEACDRFVEIDAATHASVAARIAAERLDVLVDLGGHTAASQLGALRFRPAPVQMCWLGYAGTTGAPFVDYYVADRVSAPDDDEFTERLVRLPDVCMPPDPGRVATAPPDRDGLGLPENAVVFASFNQLFKINPAVFEAWMRVLTAVPEGVLWLGRVGPDSRARLRDAAAARGIDPARLVFAETVDDDAKHFARYLVADLALDTFPYGSHTTAGDALWMGCPLVTVRGATLAGRLGAAMLESAGVPELVADSVDGFVATAIALAVDAERRRTLRERLLRHRGSAASSATTFARRLEHAFRVAVDRHAAGLEPAHIDVPATVS